MPSNLRDARFTYKPITKKRGSVYLLNVEAGGLKPGLDIAASTSFVFGDGRQPEVSYDSTVHAASFDIELKKGREYRFALTGSLISSCQLPNPRNEADRLTILAAMQGPEELVKEHLNRWDGLWEGDIVIEGDSKIQQEVRSMLYHIYSNVRAGSGLSVPPMGLTGMTYNGHIFWDADIWIMPALLVLHPELARSMIDFRIDRLEQARVNAFEHGYDGAMYPWESAGSGMEETPTWALTGVFEHHVTGCVALAAWLYYCVTGDREWLAERAYLMIAAAVDFWVSRATTDADGGRHIRNVCCADEYAQKVDDNAFTNAVAMLTAQTAIKAAEILGHEPSKAWSDLADALPVTTMANGVTSEYNGYDGAKIKQADVNLLAYPLKFITDKGQIRRDLEYYASKVPEKNTPAMTEPIFALLYSRLGDADRAGHYFTRSYRDNMQPPFGVLSECKGGKNPYFLTGAGGVLQALIFGFAGYEITDDGLRRLPSVLPPWCKSIAVSLSPGLRFADDAVLPQQP